MTGNRTAIVQGGLPSNITSHLAKLGKDGSGMIWTHLEDTAAASKFCVRARQVGQEEHSEHTYKSVSGSGVQSHVQFLWAIHTAPLLHNMSLLLHNCSNVLYNTGYRMGITLPLHNMAV